MQLRWYQKEAVNAVWSALRRGKHPCVVLPTGAGKSLVIAEICRQAIEKWNGRVLVLAHRKELLVQNAEKLAKLIPGVSIGIYSAGLKKRDTEEDVVFCGIQSVYQRAFDFGERHLAIVDEAHLIPNKTGTMYRSFLDDMNICCPQLKVVGLTATPFRMDSGLITDGDVLDEICYDASVAKLIDDGYLSRITNRKTDCEVNTALLEVRGKEFTEHSQQIAFSNLADQAVDNLIKEVNESNRKSILVFCSGIEQADRMADLIEERTGETCLVVTGDTPSLIRQQALGRFRNREIRWLVNVSVLTTGFDAPAIDCLAIFRSTTSPGLFAQIVGRGLRLYPDKTECLILDFGRNIARHGAIDDPAYGEKFLRSSARSGDSASNPKSKTESLQQCEQCEELFSKGLTMCPWCGAEAPVKSPHDVFADQLNDILSAEAEKDEPRSLNVLLVNYHEHQNKRDASKPTTLCVRYTAQGTDEWDLEHEAVREWICLNHPPGSYAWIKAAEWWEQRSDSPVPSSVAQAIEMIDRGAVREPSQIVIEKDGHWSRVTQHIFDQDKPQFDVDMFIQSREPGDDDDDWDLYLKDGWDFDDEEVPF